MKRMLLARLVRERREEAGEESFDEEGGDGCEEERCILKLLIARGVLRQQRLRRLLLAHILREGHEEEGEEVDEGDEESGGDDERRVLRLLIGSFVSPSVACLRVPSPSTQAMPASKAFSRSASMLTP